MNPGEAKKQLLWAKMGSSEVWCNLLYSHTRHLWVPHFILMELVPLRDRINRLSQRGDRCLETQGVPQKTQTGAALSWGRAFQGGETMWAKPGGDTD